MQDIDIRRIESALGVSLPDAYRVALAEFDEQGIDLPELVSNADELIQLNSHFTLDPEDLSELRGTGLLSRLRFFLLYKSPRKLAEQQSRHKQEWAGGGRFIIGTDLGEEQYFIRLAEGDPKVYCHELETDAVRQVAPNLAAWVSQARQAASSAS